MKKVKFLPLLLALLFALSILSGCKKSNIDLGEGSADEEWFYEDDPNNPEGGDTEGGEPGAASNAAESGSPNSKKSNTTADKAKEPTGDKTTAPPVEDLKDYQFVIAVGNQYGDPTPMKLGQSDYIDAVLARNAKIQKDYNVKIVYDYYNPATFADTATAAIASGNKFADLMIVKLFAAGAMFSKDLLYTYEQLPAVKMNERHWNQEFFNASKLKRGTFAGECQINKNYGGGIFYNKDIISSRSDLPDPADLVKADNWNWTTFKDFVSKAAVDRNGDGIFDDNDLWATTGATYEGLVPFFLSSGVNVFSKSADLSVKYNLSSQQALTTLSTFKSLFSTPGAHYTVNWDYDNNVSMFLKGNAVLFIGDTYDLFESSFALGYVPFPKGPGMKNYTANLRQNNSALCVPKSIKNPQTTSLVLEALAVESVKEYDLWVNQTAQQFRDPTAVKMFKDFIMPNPKVEVTQFFQGITLNTFNGTSCVIGNPIFNDQLEVAPMIKSFESLCQGDINTICNTK